MQIPSLRDSAVVALTLLLAYGCTPATSVDATTAAPPPVDSAYPGPGGEPAESSILDDIQATGVTLEAGAPVSQPFLSVGGTVYRAPGGTIQIYEYPMSATARADADAIRLDGLGTKNVKWIAPPHFYLRGANLVIYSGTEGHVLAGLTRVLGGELEIADR